MIENGRNFEFIDNPSPDSKWVQFDKLSLSHDDLFKLSSVRNLDDQHINFGQQILKKQYPHIFGLKSSVYIEKSTYSYPEEDRRGKFIQIINIRDGCGHWIAVSNVLSSQLDKVTVYDSLYSTVNAYTQKLIKRLLKNGSIKIFLVRPQIQTGSHDCGLFALAFSTALAMGEDVFDVKYDQTAMRKHLQDCFERRQLKEFPKL